MTDIRWRAANEVGHGDAAVYLIGALDEASRARFESHLASCDECQSEIAELQTVADDLALGVPQVDPPAHLLTSILANARVLSETAPPAVLPLPVHPAAATASRPAAVTAPRRRWGWTERASATIAALSLAVALGGAGYAYVQKQELQMQKQELQNTAQTAAALSETLAVMYQPGMVAKTLAPADAAPRAKAKLFLAPDGNQAVLMAYDLPQLAADKAYQLWLNNPDINKRDSGGVFRPDAKGRGHLIVRAPAALEAYKACGVTEEPAKGSQWPTGQRVLTGQL